MLKSCGVVGSFVCFLFKKEKKDDVVIFFFEGGECVLCVLFVWLCG